ncbi:MAG: ATP-binding cassette domain-containing protein [Dongiaceae bacterium]
MAVLAARSISKSFGTHAVLKDFWVEANCGDVIAIIGASGSGKSTFLRCLNMLEMPDAGLLVHGGTAYDVRELARLPPFRRTRLINRIRSRIGMVFQSYGLWSTKTLLENVIEAPVHVHGRPRQDCVEQAEALLDSVGLYAFRHAYPRRLSGGQQQRGAIARALAIDPDVILFDEPTSALDPELVNEVLLVIRRLAQDGCTMLIVTHEMAFAREVSSQVMYCEGGQIVAHGTPEEILCRQEHPSVRRFLSKAALPQPTPTRSSQ